MRASRPMVTSRSRWVRNDEPAGRVMGDYPTEDDIEEALALAAFGNDYYDDVPLALALLVAYLPRRVAAGVLGGLTQAMQADVAIRVATMDRRSAGVQRQIEQFMRRPIGSMLGRAFVDPDRGSVHELVGMLDHLDRASERDILNALEVSHPMLAAEARGLLFDFNELLRLNDRSTQELLKQISPRELMTALVGAEEEVQQHLFQNMSRRAVAMLREDMEWMQRTCTEQDIRRAQRRIIHVVGRLEHAGRIVVARRTGLRAVDPECNDQ